MIRAAVTVCAKVLPILLVGVILIEFIVTNHLAGLGTDMGALDSQIAKTKEENELLTQQVASASSLITLSAAARALGYQEPTQYLTVGTQQLPVALRESR